MASPVTSTPSSASVSSSARPMQAAPSCPDERFADFAASSDVEVGPLSRDEREDLRAEIDACVAHAWAVDPAELETIFAGESAR